jgi:hypothetical protein
MKIINNNKNLSNKQGCKWRIKQQWIIIEEK